MTDRELRQEIYIRVCRDSKFKLDYIQAAWLAASMLRCHPLEIWMAMPCMDVMQQIANGDHPAALAFSRPNGETPCAPK